MAWLLRVGRYRTPPKSKHWVLKAGSQVLTDEPRYIAIANGAFSHLAHHRGQLTVYLRLLESKVPAIYGPGTDEWN